MFRITCLILFLKCLIYIILGMNKEQLAKENLDIMYFHIKETVGRELYYMELCDIALAKIKVDN